jgi:hypothetical protein
MPLDGTLRLDSFACDFGLGLVLGDPDGKFRAANCFNAADERSARVTSHVGRRSF